MMLHAQGECALPMEKAAGCAEAAGDTLANHGCNGSARLPVAMR